MKLFISRSALNELLDIRAYYLWQGVPEICQQFANAILKKTQELIDHPDSGWGSKEGSKGSGIKGASGIKGVRVS